MEQVSLNLARKWRSAHFSEIIGQDLVVRILQNSLFKNQFFPVYLMAGQRGCGKTTTARVFAAAVNCYQLVEFQKNPKIQVPCLVCDSCIAMKYGQHPDFIEIDAASYTGVDNIRNIIDTSSFLPVLGNKKIYLIDEVHMLSKAAFNALLKILEEPSKSVLFILATTETHKIPDTVKSRCFQLLFHPVGESEVVSHLQRICDQELIAYEQTGLDMIAQSTQGSLRDAINLLEQVRFAAAKVTQVSVIDVLGHVDDSFLYQVLQCLFARDMLKLLELQKNFSKKTISIEYVLKRLLELLYDCIVIKYGSEPRYSFTMTQDFKNILLQLPMGDIIKIFDELCQLDVLIIKTSKKQLLLESSLIRLITSENQHRQIHDDQKKK